MKNVMIVALICGSASAQAPLAYEDFTLVASDDIAAIDKMGSSVAVYGDTAVVGAPNNDVGGINTGSAYIYQFNGTEWHQRKRLLPDNGVDEERFGNSVAIYEDLIVVGAWTEGGDEVQSGAVYVFRNVDQCGGCGNQWIREAKLVALDAAVGDHFGISVATDGDTIVIGAAHSHDNGINSGSAYVYEYNTLDKIWEFNQKLIASDGDINEYFGTSVSITGTIMAIGAPGGNFAYTFRWNFFTDSWNEESKISSSADYFGHSVSVYGDGLIIGAYNHNSDSYLSGSGSASIYRFDGTEWVREIVLHAENVAIEDRFGISVSMYSDTAVIGSSCQYNNSSTGSAYVYNLRGGEWSLMARIVPESNEIDGLFGHSVAVHGRMADGFTTILSGAPATDSVYIFNIVDTDGDGAFDTNDNCYLYNPDQADCNLNGIGDICDIADGYSTDVNNNNVPDECDECMGDVTGDLVVDIMDLLIVISNWGSTGSADINNDGIVDVMDILIVINTWGESCC